MNLDNEIQIKHDVNKIELSKCEMKIFQGARIKERFIAIKENTSSELQDTLPCP